ncbi:hypothetical protein [uncultured Hymenobacter sp.]|uniref:hypothetical protein n=1 Tax=uncultured Hymenobacter sp. TaxID=170016 RepID=UPI0035CB6D1A
MKPAFRLDQHPRRAQPLLSGPPAGYFEQLPQRVMDRLPQPEAETAAGWGWLLSLPPRWRTSLAASALLTGFAASFWLSAPGGPAGAPASIASIASLDAVPQTELVGYLLGPEARVEPTDLTELAAAYPDVNSSILHASDAEILDALDAQPAEEPAVL